MASGGSELLVIRIDQQPRGFAAEASQDEAGRALQDATSATPAPRVSR